MMKTIKLIGLIFGAVVLAAGIFVLEQPGVVSASGLDRGGPGGKGGYGPGSAVATPGTGQALNPLSESEEEALKKAILEEYGALNLYQSSIDQLGNNYPFSQIVLSEQQHINALVRQATKYGVDVPANPGLSAVPNFTSLVEVCQAGVEAEIADAALYDELKPVVVHADILRVFDNLQNASLNLHLPAFEACN
jgi:hypothetical protein